MEKINVLYVDDEINNLSAFRASFRRTFNIFTALSANEGIEILHTNQIEVVIADQRMPDKTGVDFFKQILNFHPNPIRILITAYSDINAVINAINEGHIYRYLSKPWNEFDLKLTIENAYQHYLLKEQNNKLNIKYQKLFSDSTDPIILFDKKGRIIEFNNSANLYFDLKHGISSRMFFNSITTNKGTINKIISQLKHDSFIKNFPVSLITKKNNLKHCIISINKVQNYHRETDGFQLVIKDLTLKVNQQNELLKTIINTQEQERVRIAKDLHDSLGQTLAAARFHTISLDPIDLPLNLKETINKIDHLLNDSIDQLQKICYDTHPQTLNNYGLISALQTLFKKITSASCSVTLDFQEDDFDFNPSSAITLYRVIQEFISNSLKHSKASEIRVSFHKTSKYIIIDMKDNGIGFNVKNPIEYDGHGLKNIHTRIESLNGEIDINSSPLGTNFGIKIPTKNIKVFNG